MNPMKVLHLRASTEVAGAEHVLLDICNRLQGEGTAFEVCLFAFEGKETPFANEVAANHIPLHFIRMQYPPFYLGEIYRLIKLFRKQSISVLHCHGARADVIGGIAAKLCGIPAVSTVHGFTAYSPKMRFYEWLDIKALRFFIRAILAVSDKLRLKLLGHGISSEKILVLRNIPRLRFRPPDVNLASRNGSLRLGFVGRLSPEKGLAFLVDAFGKLRTDQDIHLNIIGEGPEKANIRTKVKSLGLEDRVTFHGYVPDPETIYSMIDLLILPSLTEGIPLTLLEGMSFGLPIIASDVGGIPEIVENNRSGLLVKAGSVDDLTEKMNLLIKDPDMRMRLGNGARERISSICDFDKWKETLLKVYRQF